jgi:hypothetical protein
VESSSRYFNVRNNPLVELDVLSNGDYKIHHEEIKYKAKVSEEEVAEIDFFINNYLKYSKESLDTDTFLTDIVGEFIDTMPNIKKKKGENLMSSKGNKPTANMILKYIKKYIIEEAKPFATLRVTYLSYTEDTVEYIIDANFSLTDIKSLEFRIILRDFDPAIAETYKEIEEASEKVNKGFQNILDDLNKPPAPEINKMESIKEMASDVSAKLEEALASFDGTVGYFKSTNPAGVEVLIDEVYPLIKQIYDNINTVNIATESIAKSLMQM